MNNLIKSRTFTNPDTMVTAIVDSYLTGWHHLSLFDLDSGERLPEIRMFDDLDRTIEYAKLCVADIEPEIIDE